MWPPKSEAAAQKTVCNASVYHPAALRGGVDGEVFVAERLGDRGGVDDSPAPLFGIYDYMLINEKRGGRAPL